MSSESLSRTDLPSKTEMAVAVAKDVIAQIQSREQGGAGYVAHDGIYVHTDYHFESDTGDLQQYIPDMIKGKCDVCAKGALFLSKTLLFNNVDVRRYMSRWNTGFFVDRHHYMEEDLTDVFDRANLGLIETAFERYYGHAHDRGNNPALTDRAMEFGYAHSDPKDRMIAIMTNIIDNNGHFIP